MIQIRRNVFETNSSSTHSLTICKESDYEQFLEGDMYVNECCSSTSEFAKNDMVTREQIVDIMEHYKYPSDPDELIDKLKSAVDNKEEFDQILYDAGYTDEFIPYTRYYEDDELEGYERHYTTEHGDNIVVFGKYGYDS